MRTNTARFLLGTLLALALVQMAAAYTYIFDGTTHQPILWRPTSIPMLIRVGSTPTTRDTDYNNAVLTAMGMWNSVLASTQLVGTIDGQPAPTMDHDHVNEIFFASDIYGQAFGDGTLAVTTAWSYANNSRSEADIVFNGNATIVIGGTSYPLSWDSYAGGQQGTKFDIRRVALHELGHVLGLDHPDQAGQSVTAIMNSTISSIETLQPDDIMGAQHLYGAPGGAAPVNDNFANATLVNESDGRPYSGSNIYPSAASRESGEPQIVGNQGGRSVWWKWVAPANASVTIDTRGSYFDTKLGVYTGSSVSALTLVAENDDESASPHINTSLVTFNAVAGTTYYIAVDGFYHFYGSGLLYNILPDTGDITLHVNQASVNVAPTISNPANTTVNVGVAAQFTITATGVPAPSLQWQRQPAGGGGFSNLTASSTYSGVNSTTLTVSNTVTGMTGDQFRCVATNIVSAATSLAATLTVVQPVPPTITLQPSNSTINENAGTSFTMAASSGTSLTYLWQVSTNGGASWNNLSEVAPYSGTTSTTLTLTFVSSTLSGNLYRCLATNASGTTPTNGALLTVNRPPTVIALSAGRYHSLRLDNSAQLLATGTNTYGQLGTGGTTTTNSPVLVSLPGGRVVGGIAAGGQHSLFLTTGNELWATGNNDNGQLGDGTITTRTTPFQMASGVVAMAANRLHSAYLKADGTLWTVGGNDEGQLGTGNFTELHTAVQIDSNVVDLAAGIRQTLYVKSDGTLWVTGDLDGSTSTLNTPMQIATGVKTVAAGGYHSLFLKTDGTLWTLGYNPYGQLGDGTTASRNTPAQIATNVKAIAAGYFHSAFIKTDNTLWVCGFNSFGQLGDGTTTNRPTPFQLATNVTAVSASESYTLFTLTDGSLWGTGLNGNGQFGNYGTTTVTTPVRIVGGILTAPSVPAGLAVAANGANDRLNLNWQMTQGAATYEVWRNTTNNFGTATRIASVVRWTFYQDVTASGSVTYYYWITSVNPAGTSAPSVVGSGSYGSPTAPSFFLQPSPQSVLTGASASFTVAASGSPNPTLQWQRLPFGSGIWSNLSNAGSYAGVTTGTLTVNNATNGMNGDQFRCVATNSVSSATSNAAALTVTVATPPSFTVQPQPQTVSVGATVTFTAAATGSPTPTLQWQRMPYGSGTWSDLSNAGNYAGVTTGNLLVSNAASSMDGDQFRCVATNAVSSVNSNAAALTIVAPNAIRYNSTTFPSLLADSGTMVSFTCNVTNTGTSAWGGNHRVWLQDSNHNNITLAGLNGIAPGASTTLNISFYFNAIYGPGTFTYYLQAEQFGVGNFGASLPLTFVVPRQPAVTGWPSRQDISPIWGVDLNISVSGGSASFQWYKDGVAIPGATQGGYLIPGQASPADAGNYSLLVTNSAGVAMSPDIPVVWNGPAAPWQDVGRVGDVVYFLYAGSPGVISRYNMATESWLPQVTLSGTPTAFLPTAEGVFIAYGTSVVRRSVDLQPAETAVATSLSTVNRLLGFGSLVYFESAPNILAYNRGTLAPSLSFSATYSQDQQEFRGGTETAFASNTGYGFYTTNSTTQGIQRFNIAGDGTFNTEILSPNTGQFLIGKRLWVSPDETLVVSSGGAIFRTSDMTYSRGAGVNIDDLTFLVDGTPVALRGPKLVTLNPDHYFENGRVSLTGRNYRVFSRAVSSYVFGDPAVQNGNPSVTVVAQSAFTPAPLPAPYDASGQHFSTDDMFIDPNGVINILSRSGQGIVRWGVQARNFLPTLPIHGRPAYASYDPGANRYALDYLDGRVSHFYFPFGQSETFISAISAPVWGMVAMGDLTFLNFTENGGTTGDSRLVLSVDGDTDYRSGSGDFGSGLAWQSNLRRLYSYTRSNTSANGISYEDVPSNGVLPGAGHSTAGLTAPLVPNAAGTRILAMNGVITDATLSTVATLSNSVVDGTWLAGGLYTIRAQASTTQIQKWSADTSSGELGNLTVPGLPLRIFRYDDSTVVAVTNVNGYIAFHTVTSSLVLVDSSVNDTLRPPLAGPAFTTQPSAQSVSAGATATFSAAASGDPAPTFQWQRRPSGTGTWSNLSNGGNYGGVTTATLSVSGTVAGMNGDQFRCIASNIVASATSNAASLTVNSPPPAVAGDMNGDGKSDILWENTATGDRGFWLMNGTGFSSWVDVGIISPALRIAGSGDFNGDGKNDLVWENTSTGKRVIWFMNGTTFVSSFNLGIVATDWRIAAVADFNGDGKPDLLWENTVSGDRGFWLMNGTTVASWVDIGLVGTDWRIAGAGDFNGDGKPDILWENTTTGDRGVWLMNGTTFSAWSDIGVVSTDWRIAGVGDFNGDGKPDILWENTTSGLRYIWLMNGTAISSAVPLGSISTDWRIAN